MKAKRYRKLIYAFLFNFIAIVAVFAQIEFSNNEKKITVDLKKQIKVEQLNQKNSSIKINVATEFDSVLKFQTLEQKNIRLEITVEQPNADIEGFRIFLNKHNADFATPIEIFEYVGTVSFYAGKIGENITFLFDLEKFKPPFLPKETFCEDKQKMILTIVPIKSDRVEVLTSKLLVKEISFVVTPER